MKISSLQENLKNGLSVVGQVSGKNVNLPILNNVLIKANGDGISLVATDLEVGVVTKIRGKVDNEGEFTVDAKVLSDYVSLLPNKKIDLELKEKNLSVRCDNYKTSINGQSSEEYPLIPQIEKGNSYVIDADSFRKAISQVLFAVSTSETRVELTGVLFNFTNDELCLAATDSYRLAERVLKVKNDHGDRRMIIPSKTLQHLNKILSAAKGEELDDAMKNVKICASDNQILFSIGGTELVSRLIEGQYPDYKQIIPANSSTKVVVLRSELVRAIKAAAIFSKSGTNDVNIDLPANQNKMVITAVSSQTGENISELDVEMTGQDNGIVLNHRYLLDGINNISSDNIVINISDSNTPCVLTSDKEKDFLYVIMPIKQ